VLSEDGLSDRAVKFTKAIAGGEVVRVFTHTKQVDPWNCTLYQGQASGYRAKAIEAAQTHRLLYVTTSQQEGKRLARALRKQSPQRKVIRIDSETNQGSKFNEFFRDPDRWLEAEQPDILILSPSAKSGISIQGGVSVEDAYFDQVWGYFPALGTDSHMQLLGRYRPAVPRIVFCPAFIQSSADESILYPRAIARQLQRNARQLAAAYQLDELLVAEGDQLEMMATIETATMNYLADAIAVTGAQKQMAHTALVNQIERAGHQVKSAKLTTNKDAIELWKQINEEIWREDAAALAAAVIREPHTLDWARQMLESQDSTFENRTIAQKVLLHDEFPGMTFDDAEECYQVLCKDYGTMRRGVTLQAKAENLDAAKRSIELRLKQCSAKTFAPCIDYRGQQFEPR
jgi:hypothetical protein